MNEVTLTPDQQQRLAAAKDCGCLVLSGRPGKDRPVVNLFLDYCASARKVFCYVSPFRERAVVVVNANIAVRDCVIEYCEETWTLIYEHYRRLTRGVYDSQYDEGAANCSVTRMPAAHAMEFALEATRLLTEQVEEQCPNA